MGRCIRHVKLMWVMRRDTGAAFWLLWAGKSGLFERSRQPIRTSISHNMPDTDCELLYEASKEYGRRYLWALLGVTGGAYLGSVGLAGVLFYFFNPSGAGDCSFNVTMITFTLILGLALTGVSMTPSLVSAGNRLDKGFSFRHLMSSNGAQLACCLRHLLSTQSSPTPLHARDQVWCLRYA